VSRDLSNGRTRGRKLTDAAVSVRRAAVEAQVLTGRWSAHVCLDLAERFGVTGRQIHRDRARVLEMIRADPPESPADRRPVWLAELRTYRAELAARSLTEPRLAADVVRLFALEADVLGLAAPVALDITLHADPRDMAREMIAGIPDALEILGLSTAALPRLLEHPTPTTTGEPND
jgi:hypothetical protein